MFVCGRLLVTVSKWVKIDKIKKTKNKNRDTQENRQIHLIGIEMEVKVWKRKTNCYSSETESEDKVMTIVYTYIYFLFVWLVWYTFICTFAHFLGLYLAHFIAISSSILLFLNSWHFFFSLHCTTTTYLTVLFLFNHESNENNTMLKILVEGRRRIDVNWFVLGCHLKFSTHFFLLSHLICFKKYQRVIFEKIGRWLHENHKNRWTKIESRRKKK